MRDKKLETGGGRPETGKIGNRKGAEDAKEKSPPSLKGAFPCSSVCIGGSTFLLFFAFFAALR